MIKMGIKLNTHEQYQEFSFGTLYNNPSFLHIPRTLSGHDTVEIESVHVPRIDNRISMLWVLHSLFSKQLYLIIKHEMYMLTLGSFYFVHSTSSYIIKHKRYMVKIGLICIYNSKIQNITYCWYRFRLSHSGSWNICRRNALSSARINFLWLSTWRQRTLWWH